MSDGSSEHEVIALIQRHLHCSVQRLTRDRLGASNVTYFATLDTTEECVVRIAPPNTHEHVAQELWALHQCRLRGVPVPEVLAADYTPSTCHSPWMIMRRLPGVPAFPVPRSSAARQAILEQLGQYLALVHSVPLPGWGALEGSDAAMVGHAGSLWEAVQDALATRVAALPTELLSAHRVAAIQRVLEESKTFFALPSACLIHGDFQFKNVLVNDAQVRGIVDFENLLAGDPVMDFTPLFYWSRQPDADLSALQRGYGHHPLFDTHFRHKLRVYEVLLTLEILWWKVKFGETAAIRRLLARLHTLEDALRTDTIV